MPLPISPSAALSTSKGNLGALVEAGRLLVPQELVPILRRLQVQSAEDLVSYLAAFPTAVAHALGWSPESLREAEIELSRQLRGHVNEDLLSMPAGIERGFGALDPAGLFNSESN